MVRIEQGKGKKDRYVPIPRSFRGELAQFVATQRKRGADYLFESRLGDRFSTRWISEIVKRYARQAGIEKRIYPHLFRLSWIARYDPLRDRMEMIHLFDLFALR